MNNDKEMSKRQLRREQIRRKEMRSRLIGIGLVSIGAIFIAFLFIYPSFKPSAAVATAPPQSHPQANKTALGDPKASVVIDAFEDFQCPACLNYTKKIEPLVIENLVATGKVYYVFHNFPFIDGADAGNGGESDQAANAAMCASAQNKFWEMHDTIFANWNGEGQGAYADRRLTTFAETAGLDMNAFNDCFQANQHKAEIQADFDAGKTLGVQGTPSVFVNKTLLTPGSVPAYNDIVKAVDDALAKTGK